MPTRREAVGLAAFLLAITSAACGGGKKGPAAFTPPPTAVETAEAKKGSVKEELEALGTVEATESVKVATEVDALILEMPFREGSAVQKGQTMARLNDSEPTADLRRFEALRDQARLAHGRLAELATQKVASTQDRDNAEAALKVAEANVNVARAKLGKTRIVAPFSGVVGRRLVSPGAFLRTGDPIAELSRIDEVKLVFSVPERHLPAVRRGAAVRVTTVASPGRVFEGTVAIIEPGLDAGTRSAHVIAIVKNPGGELRPGMSAQVKATLGERPDAVTVPDEAVFAEGDRNFVYVVTGDTVSRRPVELGARQTGTVEITKGVAAGDRVVRAGHQKLYEGAKVATASPTTAPAGAATAK